MKLLFAVSAIAATLLSTPAFAANNRTWISGKGVDQAGCGPVVTPCRTLQYAHDNTSAGGEIDVLDPAGYGSVYITKAISIVNDGVGVAGVLATSGNAIRINAGASDAVILRGLTIEGANTADNGIVVNVAGSVTIANCVIQSFTGRGISVDALKNVSLHILNTSVSGTASGIGLVPLTGVTAIDAVLDRVIVTGNQNNGLLLAGDSGGTGVLRLSLSNSLFSSSGGDGIRLGSGAMAINAVITDSTITGNVNRGLRVSGTSAVVSLGRNTISHNATGILIESATANSYGNNQFADNGTDVDGTLTPAALK